MLRPQRGHVISIPSWDRSESCTCLPESVADVDAGMILDGAVHMLSSDVPGAQAADVEECLFEELNRGQVLSIPISFRPCAYGDSIRWNVTGFDGRAVFSDLQ